jgi:catechol 2,3-dioxygenase-like lactoylglutathione lyase family enzyme
MTVQLNHTIVPAHDKEKTAIFFAEVLGLPAPIPFGPFSAVHADNDVTLDFMNDDREIASQHYAFLVSDRDFDEIFERIRARGLSYWSDPHHHHPGEVNRRDGGRGFYFEDPNGHNLEVLTRPYGGRP